MQHRYKLAFLFTITAIVLDVVQSAQFGTPYNVTYDHRSIIINGTREVLLSGDIQYARSTPNMWPTLLQSAKDGNLNMIQTYVFWDLHEPTEGTYNFDGNADILQFLAICQEKGLYVTLRVGPYVDAEWDYGGFPIWLRNKTGIVLRDYNQPYLDAITPWLTYITKKVQPFLASNGGPIILLQIENEYSLVEAQFQNGDKYVRWIADFANSLIPDVPWIMCLQGDIPNVINTYNGLEARDVFILPHWTAWPNQPLLWTENNNCVACESWGTGTTHRPTEDIGWATTRWFAAGGCHNNYYTYHGGSNFGRTAGGPYMTTHYNLDATLDEYGFPLEPRYSYLSTMHAAILKVGPIILSQEPPKPTIVGGLQQAWVYTVANDNTSFVAFITNNDTANAASVSLSGTTYTLPPRSISIIQNGVVLFNSATMYTQPHVYNNVDKPTTKFWGYFDEKVGVYDPSTAFLSDTPPEQIATTQDTTDFLWYTRNITITNVTTALVFSQVNDMVQIFVDGFMIGSNQYKGSSVKISLNLKPGVYTLQVLSMTMGLSSFGAHQERYMRGITGTVLLGAQNITVGGWRVQSGLYGEVNKVYTNQDSFVLGYQARIGKPLTWFSAFVSATPSANSSYVVDLLGMNKGYAYINGYNLGRYWLITSSITASGCGYCDYKVEYARSSCYLGCGGYTQRHYHVPKEWLNSSGNNLLVLLEEIGGDPTNVQVQELGHPTLECGSGTEIANFASTAYVKCPGATYINQITFASFGSPPKETACGSYQTPGACNASGVVSIVESQCLGRSYCQVPVSIGLFGDPCPGTTKSLYIQATCS